MLNITVQKLGDASILRCHGRIVAGDAGSILRSAVLSQRHIRMLVVDLAEIERIDAGGLGVLLSLRESARSRAIVFKLMNATKLVEDILDRTRLRPVFEFCSVPELFCLLHRAAIGVPTPVAGWMGVSGTRSRSGSRYSPESRDRGDRVDDVDFVDDHCSKAEA